MLNFGQFQRIVESRTRVPDVVFKKNEKKLSRDKKKLELEDVKKIFEADPTKTKDYVNWLVLLFTRMDKDLFLEDLYKATDYLTIFDKAKHKFEDVSKRNIFNYKDLHDLFTCIEPFKEDETKILSKRQLRGDSPVTGQFDEIPCDDPDWDIIIPNTHAAAVYWGSGSQWCTAHSNTSTYYDNYTKDGPLYIFRDDSNPKHRFQMHIQTHQFMDSADKHYSPEKFFKDHPKIRAAVVEHWKKHPDVLSRGNKNPVSKLVDQVTGSGRGGEGWGEVLKMVLESGFDLNYESFDGDVVLIKVAQNLDYDMVELFIKNGADVTKKTTSGMTAMSAAVASDLSRSNSDFNKDEATLKICKLLAKHGADCSGSTSSNGSTASTTLVSAINRKKYQTALWLSDKEGYDPNFCDSTSKNAMHYLVMIDADSISQKPGTPSQLTIDELRTLITTLVERGVDLEVGTRNSLRTVLHLAVTKALTGGNPQTHEVIKMLIELGSNVCAREKSNKTVLDTIKETKGDSSVKQQVLDLFNGVKCS